MNLQSDLIDWFALVFFIVCWRGYASYCDYKSKNRHSLLTAANHLRLQWMREMLGRENRSIDEIMVGNLARSFTFFASTSIFVLAALFSALGYRDRANDIIKDVPFAKLNDPVWWQIKIFLLMIIFIYAFFKFTWSMRQYNYISIFIAAAPDYRVRKDEHEGIAQKGAALSANAARHFNNGLRAYYFGLATLAWFIHPILLIGSTLLVVWVTYRREFLSQTLRQLS